jgi:putative membrane protein insertion efficiency factor
MPTMAGKSGMIKRITLRLIAKLILIPRIAARGLIRLYRYTFSGLIGYHCRHLPTCSDFGDEAIKQFGLWTGGWMTLARLCRCHPFGTAGIDFVPDHPPVVARWYLPWRYGLWNQSNPNPPANIARLPK